MLRPDANDAERDERMPREQRRLMATLGVADPLHQVGPVQHGALPFANRTLSRRFVTPRQQGGSLHGALHFLSNFLLQESAHVARARAVGTFAAPGIGFLAGVFYPLVSGARSGAPSASPAARPTLGME